MPAQYQKLSDNRSSLLGGYVVVVLTKERAINAESAKTQSFSCFSLRPLRLCDLCVKYPVILKTDVFSV